jgi:hypothetical protein
MKGPLNLVSSIIATILHKRRYVILVGIAWTAIPTLSNAENRQPFYSFGSIRVLSPPYANVSATI